MSILLTFVRSISRTQVQPVMRRVAPRLPEERNMTMRFLCLYKPDKPECPPTQQEMADMGKLIGEAMKAGWLIATEGCLPSEAGARVRLSNGKFIVTDGPFAETKEVVGGFAIIEAGSKQEAIEHTKYFLQVAGGGETEIRQLYEAPAAASGKYSPRALLFRPSQPCLRLRRKLPKASGASARLAEHSRPDAYKPLTPAASFKLPYRKLPLRRASARDRCSMRRVPDRSAMNSALSVIGLQGFSARI
jgi:hypothetical protein